MNVLNLLIVSLSIINIVVATAKVTFFEQITTPSYDDTTMVRLLLLLQI